MNSGKTPQPRPSRMESRGTGSQTRAHLVHKTRALPPHGLNLPPKDHYRRKGSGPRTLNIFVTVEDLPPFAIQPLRSERQRAYAFRCQRTLRKLLHFEHRFSSHAYRVVGGPGMARIGTNYLSHDNLSALGDVALPHQNHGDFLVNM